MILDRFKKEMTNPTRVRVIQGLLNVVDEELGVGVSAEKHRKQSLLPFVGMALKAMFGLSTKADHQRAQERQNKLEEWAAQQGSTYATVIEGVNENTKSLKQIADAFDNLVKFVKHG